jgi:hypothetical protein
MDKPTHAAPPLHRRYPRGSAPPPPTGPAPRADAAAARGVGRRWPRLLPERRIFPRG